MEGTVALDDIVYSARGGCHASKEVPEEGAGAALIAKGPAAALGERGHGPALLAASPLPAEKPAGSFAAELVLGLLAIIVAALAAAGGWYCLRQRGLARGAPAESSAPQGFDNITFRDVRPRRGAPWPAPGQRPGSAFRKLSKCRQAAPAPGRASATGRCKGLCPYRVGAAGDPELRGGRETLLLPPGSGRAKRRGCRAPPAPQRAAAATILILPEPPPEPQAREAARAAGSVPRSPCRAKTGPRRGRGAPGRAGGSAGWARRGPALSTAYRNPSPSSTGQGHSVSSAQRGGRGLRGRAGRRHRLLAPAQGRAPSSQSSHSSSRPRLRGARPGAPAPPEPHCCLCYLHPLGKSGFIFCNVNFLHQDAVTCPYFDRRRQREFLASSAEQGPGPQGWGVPCGTRAPSHTPD